MISLAMFWIVCEYYLIDTSPKLQIYLEALGGILVK